MSSFEPMRAGYGNMWRTMKVNPGVVGAADKVARGIIADRARYEPVEAATGVWWFFVGILHNRESSRDFDTYLGNGQSLHKRTTIVPIGRGPFTSFLAGAIDALRIDKLDQVKEWSIERMLFAIESFNGFGYGQHGVNSPYVWAGTNHYTKGKYVADHVFDANAVDHQLGSAVVLARLCALSPEINARVNGSKPSVSPSPIAPKPPLDHVPTVPVPAPEAKPLIKSKTVWAAATAFLASAAAAIQNALEQALTDWRVWAAITVAGLAGYIIWERNGKPDIRGWFRS